MKVFQAGQQVDVPGQVLIDPASSTITYVGEALPGQGVDDAAWRIKRITFDASGNARAIEWAENGDPVAIWSQRASISYS